MLGQSRDGLQESMGSNPQRPFNVKITLSLSQMVIRRQREVMLIP